MTAARVLRLGLALVAAVVSACSSPVAPSSAAASFAGRWTYEAGTADGAVSVSGTLTLAVEGGALTGTLVADEVAAGGVQGGAPRRLTGLVGGVGRSATEVEFDVLLASGRTRRHVASRTGGTLRGTWIETDGAAVTGAGSFVARQGGA